VSDIFVSYASADRDRARAIAQALTEHGWSVWWDRTIPPGKQFDEVIEEALDAARCVVVLWSKASVASTWVKTEAAEAMRRKILVPVLIEDVKIPLEFRRLQAADLSHWNGEKAHEELQKFFASIDTNVGEGTLVTAAPEAPRTAPPPPQAVVQPEPLPVAKPEPRPVILPAESTPGPRSRSKAMLAGAAGIAALVVIAVGYTAYNERVKRVAMEERAERERRAAEEARRNAEEAAARAKLAQEEAAREAARRRADEQRRAVEDAKRAEDARRAEAAARAKAAQEEAARARAAQEEAARQQVAARAKAAQEEAARQQAAARQAEAARQQAASRPAEGATPTMRINWYDHALRFSGTLLGKPSSASLQATVYDLKTGAQIGSYTVPAIVTKQGSDFVVAGSFAIPGDSVTPQPHVHTSRLLLRRQTDGTLRYVENCPQVGKQCYR
jgi:TIR domain-containing protein